MKVIIEWGILEDIRGILMFLFLFRVNYYTFHKKLRHDALKFPFEKFTIKYLLIASGIAMVLSFFLILFGNADSDLISDILSLGVFVPYLVFLGALLIFYLLQVVYVSIRAFIYTARVYSALKADKK